ncbi:MAG: oxidoreductase [Acidobacteriales bacterium]|nr:oxidoreductase [Terriglobales bacterium]
MVQRPIYTARLLQSETLSERAQCKHLEFVVEELERFEFTAGQFVSMLAKKEEKQMTRAYSIASGPKGNNRFDLCLNRVENGFFSNYLCDLEQDQTVQLHGPHGHFVLRQPLRDCLFIATGTGVAPMRGFVEWLFAGDQLRHEGREIYLIYGTRTEAELYYADYFKAMAEQHPNFHYQPTLSRPQESWTGRKGYVQDRVQEILEARAGHGKDEMDAYICGLNLMVSANRKLLGETFGWDKKQIVFERYD